MTYYCIHCRTLHGAAEATDTIMFRTGFHYIQEARYPAGFCSHPTNHSDEDETITSCGESSSQ
ncbi:DUF3973 domain-containing protein [Paenibacillus sp. YYML68]|uniref:DUF3973 domain-containing protein n=1 Tax=Paenibacillus sp. YYML68 TaxID=2909250 RepID=UPI0037CAFAEB